MKKIILLFQILMLSIVAQQNTKIKRSVTHPQNVVIPRNAAGEFLVVLTNVTSGSEAVTIYSIGDQS